MIVMDADGNLFDDRRKSDRRKASANVSDDRRKKDRRVKDINVSKTKVKRKVNKIDD